MLNDPERFGIVEFDDNNKKLFLLEEKPKNQNQIMLLQVYMFMIIECRFC